MGADAAVACPNAGEDWANKGAAADPELDAPNPKLGVPVPPAASPCCPKEKAGALEGAAECEAPKANVEEAVAPGLADWLGPKEKAGAGAAGGAVELAAAAVD